MDVAAGNKSDESHGEKPKWVTSIEQPIELAAACAALDLAGQRC
jgi:hypothetical protein